MIGIIIPIYKCFGRLKSTELMSLNQLYTQLGKYQICLIGPLDFPWNDYIEHAAERNIILSIKEFPNDNFCSLDGYNKLMISEKFYSGFSKYEHVLIYQLDAFVFRDELDYWCRLNYDFIGAPWTGLHKYKGVPLIGVGNGGFSLRNVNSMLDLLKKLRLLEVLQQYQDFNWKGILPRLPRLVLNIIKLENVESVFERSYTFQEDVFWCKDAPNEISAFKSKSIILEVLGKVLLRQVFKIPTTEIASQFATETKPSFFFKKNNYRLPFGCHAWEKYEPEFWEPFTNGKAQEKFL